MTNKFHDLITRMANELDEYRRLLLDDCTVTHRLSNEARAALAEADEPAAPLPLADTHYEWELEDAEGEWQAGGSSNSQSDVEREGRHYLQTYAQNGPHKLIIRQHTTQTINEITNDH